MAAITVLTEFNAISDNNSYAVKGLKSFTQIFAATSIPLLRTGAKEQHVCYAALTGAMTINCATVVAQLRQFDVVVFHFSSDASIRIITFGTNMKPLGTLSTIASADALATFMYDGVNLVEQSRSINLA